jgi:inorganic pyrophosphatase
MSFLRAKPIGVMPMIDQGEQDDKIIAVHADDPEFRGFSDISELPKHRLMEIKRSITLQVCRCDPTCLYDVVFKVTNYRGAASLCEIYRAQILDHYIWNGARGEGGSME